MFNILLTISYISLFGLTALAYHAGGASIKSRQKLSCSSFINRRHNNRESFLALVPKTATSLYSSKSFDIQSIFESFFAGQNVGMLSKAQQEQRASADAQKVLDDQRRVALEACNRNITSNRDILLKASTKDYDDTDQVVQSLINLEKLMRERNKLDNGETSKETLLNLNGGWRLIFTTGTVDTQKKFGRRINYFPLKAMQTFNTTDYSITNGIYLGETFAALKFFGQFEWKEKPRKLEFDFDSIEVLGFNFNLPKGKAADLGKATGLGSDNNRELIEKDRKPFFNWISADSDIATARGGGGGLALWKRVY